MSAGAALPRAWRWLAERPHQRRGMRALEASVGAMLLYRVLTEWPFAAYLWGPHGLGTGSIAPLVGAAPAAFLDRAFATETGTLAVLAVLALGALGLLGGVRSRLPVALALAAFLLLEYRTPILPDGGDNITRLVLVYLLLALPPGARAPDGALRVFFHNCGVLAIAVQLGIMYFVAGLAKAHGATWYHGVAMYYIAQVGLFASPWAQALFTTPLVVTAATYAPMLFDLFFPLAMLSPLRLAWGVAGVAFHAALALLMGLVTFSTVMIGANLFFVRDAEWAAAGDWLRRRLRRAGRAGAS